MFKCIARVDDEHSRRARLPEDCGRALRHPPLRREECPVNIDRAGRYASLGRRWLAFQISQSLLVALRDTPA